MPRSPRRVSKSGYYHVTMRGNAKGIIFECDAHRRKFLQILERCKEEFCITIIAWCLMDNHVHLIVDVGEKSLSEPLHWVATTYACYFNYCEGRAGHLFQCPFGSKPIEYDRQLLNTVMYVHLNPQRAAICAQEEYAWSSYREYERDATISNVEPVLEMVGGREQFLSLSLDLDQVVRVRGPRWPRSDEEALAIARWELGSDAVRILRQSSRKQRNAYIYLLRQRGLIPNQIARLCALSDRTVRKIILSESKRLEQAQGKGIPLKR